MQPDKPTPNYDFIMNPAAAPKHSPLGGNSMATRLLIVVGGLFILVVVVGIVIRLLSGGGGGSFNKAAMLTVAQDQTEIIRLSSDGVLHSVSQTNKNFSITAQLGLQSEQQKLLTYLSAHGYKVDKKSLALKHSSKTDLQLSGAQSSSTYDQVYSGIMEQALQGYQRDLTAAYKDGGPSAKTVLTSSYDSSQLLLTQLTGEVHEQSDTGATN